MVEQGVATNRLPAANRKLHANSSINLETGARCPAACGSTQTFSLEMAATDRVTDFANRADYSPDMVYRHEKKGWRYIPVHPFFEEIPSHDPKFEEYAEDLVEAYWEVDGDVVFLNVSLSADVDRPTGLYFRTRVDGGNEAHAVIEEPFISTSIFERAMDSLYSTGRIHDAFPEKLSFVESASPENQQ